MAVQVVFETHSISEDNERGVATGWLPGRLSAAGRDAARRLGARRRADPLDAALASDLRRAVETVEIAFARSTVPVLLDWRLRECDYGELNGTDAAALHAARRRHLDEPHPGGESWREAVARVARALDDVATRWGGGRVLIVGHVATRWALDHVAAGVPLEALVDEDFAWQEGWEYVLA